jgi:hypothetical protein
MSQPMMQRCEHPIFMEQPELWGDTAAIGRAASPRAAVRAYAGIWRRQKDLGLEVGTVLTDRVIATLPADAELPRQLREIADCLKVEPSDFELTSTAGEGAVAVHLKGWHPTFAERRAS